jgi:hypothetical protein
VTGATDPNLSAILQKAKTDTGGMTAPIAQQHDVRHMNWCLSLNNTSLPDLSSGSGVSFNKVDTFNQQLFVLGVSKAHLTLLIPILTSDDQYRIILSNLHH